MTKRCSLLVIYKTDVLFMLLHLIYTMLIVSASKLLFRFLMECELLF